MVVWCSYSLRASVVYAFHMSVNAGGSDKSRLATFCCSDEATVHSRSPPGSSEWHSEDEVSITYRLLSLKYAAVP